MPKNLPPAGSFHESSNDLLLKEIRSARGEETAKLIQTADGQPWNGIDGLTRLSAASASIENIVHRLANCKQGNQNTRHDAQDYKQG